MAERHIKASNVCESSGECPASTPDSSAVLLGLVRLLAQQAAREWLATEEHL